MLYAQNYKLKSGSDYVTSLPIFKKLHKYFFFSTAICDQLNKLYFLKFNFLFYDS